jgi:hypothetical protein
MSRVNTKIRYRVVYQSLTHGRSAILQSVYDPDVVG